MYTHTAIFILLAVLQTGPHNSAFKFIFQQAGLLFCLASAFKIIFRLAGAFGCFRVDERLLYITPLRCWFSLDFTISGILSGIFFIIISGDPFFLPPLSTEIVQVKKGSLLTPNSTFKPSAEFVPPPHLFAYQRPW